MLSDKTINDMITLDEINITPYFKKAKIHFNKEKRRRGIKEELKNGAYFFTIYKNNELTAYIEYLKTNGKMGKFPSIQLHPDHPKTISILKISQRIREHLSKNTPNLIRSACHDSNHKSIKFHDKLGFKKVGKDKDRILYEISGRELLKTLARYSIRNK